MAGNSIEPRMRGSVKEYRILPFVRNLCSKYKKQ